MSNRKRQDEFQSHAFIVKFYFTSGKSSLVIILL